MAAKVDIISEYAREFMTEWRESRGEGGARLGLTANAGLFCPEELGILRTSRGVLAICPEKAGFLRTK